MWLYWSLASKVGTQSFLVFCVSETARLTINIMPDKIVVETRVKPGSHNVQYHPLVKPNKILLPPLHIKLGEMKNFVKAIEKEGSGLAIPQKFPWISMAKLKSSIFDGPQIRELMKDPMFDEALSESEQSARQSLKSVVTNFLGLYQIAEYEKEIEELQKSFSGHECQPNCTLGGHTWTIFQRTVEFWVKS